MNVVNITQRLWARGLLLSVFALFVCARASLAQPSPPVELIVRPADNATSLMQLLEAPAARRDGSPLLDDALAVRPTLMREGRGTIASRSSAIPAFTITVADSAALRQLRSRWEARSDVAYAQTNDVFTLDDAQLQRGNSGEQAPHSVLRQASNLFADSLDHLDVVRAREAHEVTKGEGTRIGILDTGLYLDHPDLRDQIWVNPAEDVNGNGRFDPADLDGVDADNNGVVDDVIGYDFVDRPGFYLDGEYETRDSDPSADLNGAFSGHGTLVAGVAAGRPTGNRGVVGVAPNAQIVPLRAFAGDGRGQTDDIAAAIVYAADEGLDVINLSFGRSRPAPLLEEAIQYATRRGTVVVASAGNNSTDDPHYPSDYPDVVSTMWLAEDGEGIPQISRSQFGIGVDIGAPGSNVFTTRFPRTALADSASAPPTLTIDDLYGNANGSSFAAPMVAGTAALLSALDSTLAPASIRDILLSTAADINAPGWDHVTAAGRLDARRAVASAVPARTEILSPAHDSGTRGQSPLAITGTALHPRFKSYQVFYAKGTRDFDVRAEPWTPIGDASPVQQRRDTLAVWDLPSLVSSDTSLADGEGTFTLRLVTTLTDGTTVEDRRRLILDRTPPRLTVRFLGAGLVDGRWGVVADIETDDDTRATLDVRHGSREATRRSEYRGRRHGLNWRDDVGGGGPASVRIRATNASGLTTTRDTSIVLPPDRQNTALLQRTKTRVPAGQLLPTAPDFDSDGLLEIVLNQRQRGGLSDTLRAFEWAGDGFVAADTLIANVFPRDVGDTDGDGLSELLTQVAANTLLLEQSTPRSPLPSEQAFIDSTGLGGASGEDVLIGTLLTDLDADGAGEIVGNTGTEWRLLEFTGDTYEEVVRLQNPTSPETIDSLQNANTFGTAAALDGDFDADGRGDLLLGDRDGDWMIFESTGDDQMAPVWTFETDRVDAGDRFAGGDVDGDGQTEFVTFSTFFPLPIGDGDFEPPLSFYHVWDAVGDNDYRRVNRLPIAGESGDGGITTGDLDGDGRDEVIVSHPPALIFLDAAADGRWSVAYHDAQSPGLLSRTLTTADFDGNGTPEVLATTTGEHLVRFVPQQAAADRPPPQWREARPLGASSLRLAWEAPGADSVTVFAATGDQAFDPVATVTGSHLTQTETTTLRRYALAAWRGGERSPLSERRTVRPHAPAVVDSVAYPDARSVRLTFTEPLAPQTRAHQFSFDGETPETLLFRADHRSVVLRFAAPITMGPLTWSDVKDEDGLAVAQTSVGLAPPANPQRTLFVREAAFVDPRRVRLTFSDAVDPSTARDTSHYQLRPRGTVQEVQMDATTPQSVQLRIDGIVVGATGLEASLSLSGIRSASGAALAPEGNTIALSAPAQDLAEVFVYPNPYRAQQHAGGLTVAGLPPEATLHVLSPDGRLVRTMNAERSTTGGMEWDLTDQAGERVPSGVYLIRVNAPEGGSVIRKVAILR